MPVRDHSPQIIDTFNGLFDQGDPDKCPIDHFQECENLKFIGNSSIATRDGLGIYQDIAAPLGNIVRIYNYVTVNGQSLLVLTWDGTDGKIYHVTSPTTVLGPILTIAGMTDFAFAPYAGRAYISPFSSFAVGDLWHEKGLQNEFVYVYMGDGTAARKAGGNPPTGTIVVGNGAAGNTDAGFHLFGVVFETNTGFLSAPAAFAGFTTNANLSVSFSSVPVSAQSFVTKRHIVATKIIVDYNGNTTGYQYYFIPNATIGDNTTTTLSNISFFDADLLEDASYLLDNFAEIPAGAGLGFYNDRLALWTSFDEISLVRISTRGEPEVFNQISGFLLVPPDGNPVTNAAELRDVFYVTKRNRTVAFADNEDEPATWPMSVIDTAIGTSVHGIATVLDTGGTSVDYLIMASYAGIVLFNGKYIFPELSWKISAFWLRQNSVDFRYIQLLNDNVNKIIYCTLPDRRLLVGNYLKGMDPKNVRWMPTRFDIDINTIALYNINELIIGAEGRRA